MIENYELIERLLNERATLLARLNLLPYSGTPEIKENKSGKYLYMRKRELGKLTSTYIDKYSDELYQVLLKSSKDYRELSKQIKGIEKQLIKLQYSFCEISLRVEQNILFARVNMKSNIYDQAILEGVATTYPQTETILDNGIVSGMTATDIQKILNLKHSWEFILDKGVISSKSSYHILCYIANLVNEGFYNNGGRIRVVPVSIGGSSYTPPLPIESDVKINIENITNSNKKPIEIAIDLCLYCMKTQIFNDGNKRAAVIFANHYLISKGEGVLVIPEKKVVEFKKLLVDYYENKDLDSIKTFMLTNCWRQF